MDRNEAVDQLKSYLQEYLESQGILFDQHGMFRCINPEHEDSTPSSNVVPGNTEVFHCHGCGVSGDIYTAAHFLERLPISGKLFFLDTVKNLAERFNVTYELQNLSEPERIDLMKLRAYRDASLIVADGAQDEFLQERGWTKETAKEWGIGGISSVEDYTKKMVALGWSKEYMENEGLLKRGIFNRNNLIFTIHDEDGTVVAFAARKMRGLKEGENKYDNSAAWTRYTKGAMFYGLHKAKKAQGRVYIFEGYGDVVTAYQAGLKRAIALTCRNISKEQIKLLVSMGITQVAICLDGDSEGQKGAKQVLDSLLAIGAGTVFDIRIVRMPEDVDPDNLVREGGLAALEKTRHYTSFEWKIEQLTQGMSKDLHDVAAEMIPTVRQEKNLVLRDKMIKALSAATAVPMGDIRREIERLENETVFARDQRAREIGFEAIKRMQQGDDPKFVASDILLQIEQLDRSYTPDSLSEDEYIHALRSIRSDLENPDRPPKLAMGRFSVMETCLDKWPRSQALIGVAGQPNIGKTSFLRSLSWEIALNNPDALCLYMSIDDTRARMIPPIIAYDQGLRIEQVVNPLERMNEAERKKYDAGWNRLTTEFADRYVIKDAEQGTTLDALEMHIQKYSRQYPNKSLVVFLDNFHNLSEVYRGGGENIRERVEQCANRVKLMTVRHNIPIVMTIELKKLGEFKGVVRRPRNDDIKETGKIDYVCDMILMCHQDLHNNLATEAKWMKNGKTMPILEVRVSKNKIGSFKGNFYLMFDPEKNGFKEPSIEFMDHMNNQLRLTNDTKRDENMSIGGQVKDTAGIR